MEKGDKAKEIAAMLEGMTGPVEAAKLLDTDEPHEPPIYTANFRTEAGGDKPKLRLVWAAPLDNQILEARMAVPLQEVLSNKRNSDKHDDHIGRVFMYASDGYNMNVLRDMFGFAEANKLDVISADYSSFDATISELLIKEAFKILIGTSPTAQRICERFVTKQLISPWGLRTVKGMVPSGSVFTNLVDSVVNAFVLEYIAIRLGIDVAYRVNGDDSVAVYSDVVSDPELELFSSELGIQMNPTKQARDSKSCQFNKSYWGYEYVGPVPSANRVINSLVYRDSMLEGKRIGANEECLRSLQVLDRLMYHPWRDKLLKLIYENSYLDDGHSALDYRWRLPRSTINTIVEDNQYVDMSTYINNLDNTFWVKIYE